ncbi:MAG: hypothetical protein F4Y86_10325 [Gammaproteobacteria bacterium]|nr:hypothetical protein [Gammaproteobacteria bacterium]
MAMPPTNRVTYNQSLAGVYGAFGAGGGLQAFYLQSAITPADLDKISLISDIPGSERWSVRDLFQREVDNDRITNGLLPYLEESERIKFFNPLTLTLLPTGDDGYTIETTMPAFLQGDLTEDEITWQTLEHEESFRVKWIDDEDRYARLEWNDRRTRLVAIDGQHRLSALKRFKLDEAAESHRTFLSWRIPVVVVSFRAIDVSSESPTVLDVVRSLFVYINQQARTINPARAILLSDESINAVCTQELIEHSHRIDAEGESRRTVPLLFYDWRGEERDGRPISSPVAMKSVEEINNWFHYYILGEDLSPAQKVALKVTPATSLNGAFVDQRLNYQYSNLAREQFRTTVLPAVTFFLENFKPYSDYIGHIRKMEKDCTDGDDIGSYALSRLRFGTILAPDPILAAVDERVREVVAAVDSIKNSSFGRLLREDIGMRGIVCAFGSLFEALGPPGDWLAYAKWFTKATNAAYSAGLLTVENRQTRRLLHQIAIGHNDDTINYRLGDAESALGAYVELLVYVYGDDVEDFEEYWDQIWDSAFSRLLATLTRGYKKEVRLELKEKEEYRDGGKKLTEAVKKEAEKRARRHVGRLEKALFPE